MSTSTVAPALDIEGLSIAINGVNVVDGVSLSAARGRVVAIVGESGCGKSLTALSILKLLPKAARISGGRVRVDGQELSAMSERALADVRGDRVSVIFQEPIASLNPLMRVGAQVAEALVVHRGLGARAAKEEAVEMIGRVGIPDPARRAQQYPFELSGGMCQRIMIASALISRPALLIADEPTTALDVTIQAQILDLMKQLQADVGAAVLLITHDMGVVADMADEVCVMYGGRIVESGPVDDLFKTPRHPYTQLLLATVPKLEGERKSLLRTIEGIVPSADAWPSGCRFRSRCPLAAEMCAQTPPLTPVGHAHAAACWRLDEAASLA